MSRCPEVWRAHQQALDATKVEITRKDPKTGEGADLIYIFGRPIPFVENREIMEQRLLDRGLYWEVITELLDEIFGIATETPISSLKRVESFV
jgi:hypothetical protein